MQKHKLQLLAILLTVFFSPHHTPASPQETAIPEDVSLCDYSGTTVFVKEIALEGPTVFLVKTTPSSCDFWTLTHAKTLVEKIVSIANEEEQLEYLEIISNYLSNLYDQHSKEYFLAHSEMAKLFEQFSITPQQLDVLTNRWSIALPGAKVSEKITPTNVALWICNQTDVAIIDPKTGDTIVHPHFTLEERTILLFSRKSSINQLPFLYLKDTAPTKPSEKKDVQITEKPAIAKKKAPTRTPTKVPIIPASSTFSVMKLLGGITGVVAFFKTFTFFKGTTTPPPPPPKPSSNPKPTSDPKPGSKPENPTTSSATSSGKGGPAPTSQSVASTPPTHRVKRSSSPQPPAKPHAELKRTKSLPNIHLSDKTQPPKHTTTRGTTPRIVPPSSTDDEQTSSPIDDSRPVTPVSPSILDTGFVQERPKMKKSERPFRRKIKRKLKICNALVKKMKKSHRPDVTQPTSPVADTNDPLNTAFVVYSPDKTPRPRALTQTIQIRKPKPVGPDPSIGHRDRPRSSTDTNPLNTAFLFDTPEKDHAFMPVSNEPQIADEEDCILYLTAMHEAMGIITYPRTYTVAGNHVTQRTESSSPELVGSTTGLENALLDELLGNYQEPQFVAVYCLFQDEATSEWYYYSWQDYLSLYEWAMKYEMTDALKCFDEINRECIDSKIPPNNKLQFIQDSLQHLDKEIGGFKDWFIDLDRRYTETKPKKCSSEHRYFDPLQTFPVEAQKQLSELQIIKN